MEGEIGKRVFFRMKLFVAKGEPNSRMTVEFLRRFLGEHLPDSCELQIIDVTEDFEEALRENVLVAPTLIIYEPPPPVKIVGAITEPQRLWSILGIPDSR